MAYTLGTCPHCNSMMSMPDESPLVRCPTCGSEVAVAEAAAIANTAAQAQPAASNDPYAGATQQVAGNQGAYAQNTPNPSQVPVPPTYSQYDPNTQYNQGQIPPFVATWQTNVLFTVLGILAGMLVSGLCNSVEASGSAILALAFAYIIYSIIHAAKIYPAAFTDQPIVKSNELMSFLNAFAGGLIFGLIWNHNLTRKDKGVAHIVYIVLIVVVFVLAILSGFMIGLGYVA